MSYIPYDGSMTLGGLFISLLRLERSEIGSDFNAFHDSAACALDSDLEGIKIGAVLLSPNQWQSQLVATIGAAARAETVAAAATTTTTTTTET